MMDRFVKLIAEYQTRVQEAVALLERHHGTSPLAWLRQELPQTGYLGPGNTIPFFFHGNGCAVGLPTGPVDWDFGYGGRMDGFDRWRLWNFGVISTDNRFPEFAGEEAFQQTFREAIACGLIQQRFRFAQDNLFYLSEPAAGEENEPVGT